MWARFHVNCSDNPREESESERGAGSDVLRGTEGWSWEFARGVERVRLLFWVIWRLPVAQATDGSLPIATDNDREVCRLEDVRDTPFTIDEDCEMSIRRGS